MLEIILLAGIALIIGTVAAIVTIPKTEAKLQKAIQDGRIILQEGKITDEPKFQSIMHTLLNSTAVVIHKVEVADLYMRLRDLELVKK